MARRSIDCRPFIAPSNGAFRPRSPAERRAARALFGLPLDDTLALCVGRVVQKKNLERVLQFSADRYRLVVCGGRRTVPAHVFDLGSIPHARMPDVFASA